VPNGKNQPFTAPVGLLYQGGQARVFAITGGDTLARVDPNSPFLMMGIMDTGGTGLGRPIPVTAGGALLPGGGPFVLPLAFGERGYVSPSTTRSPSGGLVYFPASTPGDASINCRATFSSNLYAFFASTGLGAFDANPQGQNGNSRVGVDSGKLTGAYARDGRLMVGRSGGFGLQGASTRVYGDTLATIEAPPPGGGGYGRITLRVERLTESVF